MIFVFTPQASSALACPCFRYNSSAAPVFHEDKTP